MYGNTERKAPRFRSIGETPFRSDRLLDEGLNQSETARRLTVARQTVSEWLRQYRAQGEAGLRKAGRAGRKPLLDATQLERLEILLLKGPEAHGFPTPLWTCPRVARLIRDEFGVRYHEGHVWKILRASALEPATPGRQSPRAQRRGHPRLEVQEVAGH